MTTATLTPLQLAAAARPARPTAGPAGAPVGRPHDRREAPGIVLTARGRSLLRLAVLAGATVVLATALVLAWVAVAASVAPGASAGDGGTGVVTVAGAFGPAGGDVDRTVAVVVAPGDTLWQLAREHAPDRDPRAVVADIVTLNDLGSTGVQAGVRVLVPVG